MRTVIVRDILKDKVLMSGESARLLQGPIEAMIGAAASSPAALTVDFVGVEGMAPSFLDELLTVFESVLPGGTAGKTSGLIVANAPARLSSKFEAVARGHGMVVQALPDGAWLLAGARESSA
jgi:hypothetical protein